MPYMERFGYIGIAIIKDYGFRGFSLGNPFIFVMKYLFGIV